MRARYRAGAVTVALMLAVAGGAWAARRPWWGYDPGPWRVDVARDHETPALLHALEQRGREPRFIVRAVVQAPSPFGCFTDPQSGQIYCVDPPIGPGGQPILSAPRWDLTGTVLVYSRATD